MSHIDKYACSTLMIIYRDKSNIHYPENQCFPLDTLSLMILSLISKLDIYFFFAYNINNFVS